MSIWLNRFWKRNLFLKFIYNTNIMFINFERKISLFEYDNADNCPVIRNSWIIVWISEAIEISIVPSWIPCFVTNIYNDLDLKQELGVILWKARYSFTTITAAIRYTFVTVKLKKSTPFSFAYLYILRILVCWSRHTIAWFSLRHTCHKIFFALYRPCFRILRIRLSRVLWQKW